MIVIADTSVVLNLCRISAAGLLKEMYGQVLVPETVAREFDRLAREHTRFSGLKLPDFISVQHDSIPMPLTVAQADLDAGEKAAISLALAAPSSLLLIDEARGRALAVELGLSTIGILGILIEARRGGMVPSVKAVLDRLEKEAGFWIGSDIRARVLKLAGE